MHMASVRWTALARSTRCSLTIFLCLSFWLHPNKCAPLEPQMPLRELYIYQYVKQSDWTGLLNRRYTNTLDQAQISQLRTSLVFMPTTGTDSTPALSVQPSVNANPPHLISGFQITEHSVGSAPTTSSVTMSNGWHMSVTKLGDVRVSNQALFDKSTGDGYLSRWVGKITLLNALNLDFNDLMMKLSTALGGLDSADASWPRESTAGWIHQAFDNYRRANAAKFMDVPNVFNPRIKFTDGANPSQSLDFDESWTRGGSPIPFLNNLIPDPESILPAGSSSLEDVEALEGYETDTSKTPFVPDPGGFGSPIQSPPFVPDPGGFGSPIHSPPRSPVADGSPPNPPLLRQITQLNEVPAALIHPNEPEEVYFYDLDFLMCAEESLEKKLKHRSLCTTAEKQPANLLNEPSTNVQIRTGGILKYVSSVGGRALAVGSTAALLALPAFIILDFIEGQWKAAAWAMGGTAAAIGTTAAVSSALAGASLAGFSLAGPVGLFVGALVGLLFSIIPGLFHKKHTPNANNITQIIQFAFFGDATHTGNEKCNENLAQNNQTQNCTASYGAGALASMFDWDIYDASVFLIEMNQGYAMTIPDMALNFTVYDYNNPAASANVTAIIDCGKPRCTYPACSAADLISCPHPKFSLKRNLVVLPIINQSADVVYNLVNTGECRIVSDPIEGEIMYTPSGSGINKFSGTGISLAVNASSSTTAYSNHSAPLNGSTSFSSSAPLNSSALSSSNISSTGTFLILGNHTIVPIDASTNGSVKIDASISPNVSSYTIPPMSGEWKNMPDTPTNITGRPVYILCNLTANIPSLVTLNYTLAQSGHVNSSASTDGDTSGYVTPPRPHPFTPLNASNAVCLYDSKNPSSELCLPNGTFTSCYKGSFGFKTSNFDTLTSDHPANLTLNIQQVLDSDGVDVTPDASFTANASAADGLALAISTLTSQKQTLEVGSLGAPLAPAMCIYSAPNFLGDVYCLGLGGTNLSSNLINKTASLTLSPGIVAWLYPEYYGNPLGTYVSTNVADLNGIPYKTDLAFKDIVAAAWIYNATAPTSSKYR